MSGHPYHQSKGKKKSLREDHTAHGPEKQPTERNNECKVPEEGFGIFAAVSCYLCLSTLLRRPRARCAPHPAAAAAAAPPRSRWLYAPRSCGGSARSRGPAALLHPRLRRSPPHGAAAAHRPRPSPLLRPRPPTPPPHLPPPHPPVSLPSAVLVAGPVVTAKCYPCGFALPSPGGRSAFSAGGPGAEGLDGPEWKKVSAKRFGIKESMIPAEAWNVLHRLRSRGASPASVALLVFGLLSSPILKRHCWSWISVRDPATELVSSALWMRAHPFK